MELNKIDVKIERDVMDAYRSNGYENMAVLRYKDDDHALMTLPGTMRNVVTRLHDQGVIGFVVDYSNIEVTGWQFAYDSSVFQDPNIDYVAAYIGIDPKVLPEDAKHNKSLIYDSLESAVQSVLVKLKDNS